MAISKLGTLSLFLVIILYSTLLGGIAYAHLVYFPVYLSALPASAVLVNGPYGLNEGVFWGIIHPLLLLSLITALVLNWRFKSRRGLILMSFALYVAMLVVSQVYFIPELEAFRHSPKSSLSPAEWLIRGQRWQKLSWLRGAVCYGAFVPLLLALTMPVGIRGEIQKATAI